MSNNVHQPEPGQHWPPLQFEQISPVELVGEGFLLPRDPCGTKPRATYCSVILAATPYISG